MLAATSKVSVNPSKCMEGIEVTHEWSQIFEQPWPSRRPLASFYAEFHRCHLEID